MEFWWWVILLAGIPLTSCGKLDVLVTLDTTRLLQITSSKFLSLSVSPGLLSSDNNYSEATLSMLQGLSPAYLRVGGPDKQDIRYSNAANTSKGLVFNDLQLSALNQLASDTGMRLIISINPNNTLTLLQQTNLHGFNPIWQLGYEVLEKNNTDSFSGTDLGRDVVELRKVMDTLPQYQQTVLLAPDFVAYDGGDYLQILKDFMQEARDVTQVIPVQLKCQMVQDNEEEEFVEKLTGLIKNVRKVLTTKKARSGSNNNLTKKQIWLAESGEESYTGEFTDAMVWALKLGHAARLGYQVVLRRPMQLTHPTPDYWVSLLYRNLVGRAVLPARLMPRESSVTVFAHCTVYYERPIHGALDPEWEYERGAVTLWGVNTAEETARLTLRGGSRQGHVHLYTLTADYWEDMELGNTLLNGELLYLTQGTLPKLTPQVRTMGRSLSVSIPALSVFYIVLPDMRSPACLSYSEISTSEELVSLSQRKMLQTPNDLKDNYHISSKTKENEQDDIIVEKGGIFEDIEESDKNSNIPKNRLKNNMKFDVKEWMRTVINEMRNDIKFGKQLQGFKESKDVADVWAHQSPELHSLKSVENAPVSRINSRSVSIIHESPLSFDLPLNDDTEDDSTDKLYLSLATSGKDDTITKELIRDNDSLSVEEAKKIASLRLKRSEDDKDFRFPNKENIDIPLSLYRRINLLRQNRPLSIYNYMKRPRVSEDTNQELQQTSVMNKTGYAGNKEKIKVLKMGSQLMGSSERRSTNKVGENEKHIELKNNKDREPDRLHYLPGEFYEILGNLKLDSNVSLKDMEESRETVASVVKKPSECENSRSILKVSTKPENEHQEDSRVVETATEQMNQYFERTENIKILLNKVPSSDSNQRKVDEMKNNFERRNINEVKSSKSEFKEKTKPRNDSEIHKDQERPSFQVSNTKEGNEKEDDHTETSHNRLKREIKNNDQDRYNTDEMRFLKEETEENSTEPEITGELNSVLDKLTDEGERLLESFDLDNEKITSDYEYSLQSDTNTTESPPAVDETSTTGFKDKSIQTNEEQWNSHAYVGNNLLNEKIIKKKIKYPIVVPKDSILSSKSKSNSNETKTDINKAGEKINPKYEVIIETSKDKQNKINQTDYFTESHNKTGQSNNNQFYLDSILHKNDKEFESNDESDIMESTFSPFNNKEIVTSTNLELLQDPNITVNSTMTSTTQKEISELIPFDKEFNVSGILKKENFNEIKNTNMSSNASKTSITIRKPDKILLETQKNKHRGEDIMQKEISSNILLPKLLPSLNTHPSLIPLPRLPTSNQNTNQPKTIKNRRTESNIKSKPITITSEKIPTIELLTTMQRMRLEAFKARLEEAREKILNLTHTKVTPNLLPLKRVVKREIPLNTGNLDSVVVNNNLNSEIQNTKQPEKQNFGSYHNKALVKYLENMLLNTPSTYKSNHIHRLVRGIADDNSYNQYSSLKRTLNPSIQLTRSKGVGMNVNNNYGFGTKREPREIKYSCLEDDFSDFGIEKETEKMSKNSNLERKEREDNMFGKDVRFLLQNFPKKSQTVILTSPDPKRSKRSIDNDIERNEDEIKALLTNEIIKDGPLNYISDSDSSESTLNTMLRETLTKAVMNKTGIERMLELAKQYQKTNPTSVEIFRQNRKDEKGKPGEMQIHQNEDENKAEEVTDMVENTDLKPDTPQKNNVFTQGTDSVNEADHGTSDPKQITQTELKESISSDQNSGILPDIPLSSLIEKVQAFFKTITTMIKNTFM